MYRGGIEGQPYHFFLKILRNFHYSKSENFKKRSVLDQFLVSSKKMFNVRTLKALIYLITTAKASMGCGPGYQIPLFQIQ